MLLRPLNTPSRESIVLLFALGISLMSGTDSKAQALPPSYERFEESVFLRYLNAGGDRINTIPDLGLSFGGRIHRAVLDSGSTGIVIAAALIPGFDSLPALGDGELTYTSSGRIMIGRWVTTPLSIVGADGTQVQTEPMPVLGVTQVRCLREARSCTPDDAPRDIAMIGVGFAREHDRQAQSTPDKNPLLRLPNGGGRMRRGYILTSQGVHVGLSRETTEGAFSFVKLDRQPGEPDWSPVPACITLDDKLPAACGTMLVDTGVSAMFMTLPPQQVGDGAAGLAPGTQVSISVGTQDKHKELYSFEAGIGSAMAPEGVHLDVSDKRVFVNTSYHFLNGYDVLYDADGGYVGFRRR